MQDNNLITPRTHLVVSTDLEPDDFLALRLLFKELSQYQERDYPSVQILVGEGNAPEARVRKMKEIVVAAMYDGLIPGGCFRNIEILPGSSARGDEDIIHQYYNQQFFGQEQGQGSNQGSQIPEARERIVSGI